LDALRLSKSKHFNYDQHSKRPQNSNRSKTLDKVNTSYNEAGKLNYEDYMNELSSLELDLLYTAYHQDFVTFGYDPKD